MRFVVAGGPEVYREWITGPLHWFILGDSALDLDGLERLWAGGPMLMESWGSR